MMKTSARGWSNAPGVVLMGEVDSKFFIPYHSLMQATYKTNLRCGACLESIRPLFDHDPRVQHWSVNLNADGKPLTIEGDLNRTDVEQMLQSKGYRVLDASPLATPLPSSLPQKFDITRYWPLLLIAVYLVGMTLMVEWLNPPVHGMRAMAHFMAGFFLVFSFFKFLNLQAFADSYRMYDVIAMAWWPWGWIYPFVELALGIAYLVAGHSVIVNAVTLVVMLLGTAGVANSLLKKRKIQCACLGAVFNLPMSWVTLVEDLLMAGMAAVMLVI
jgi:hypothetical protein